MNEIKANTLDNQGRPIAIGIKFFLLVWIRLVTLVFLVLHRPPEIPSIGRRMGFGDGFNRLSEWLKNFLSPIFYPREIRTRESACMR